MAGDPIGQEALGSLAKLGYAVYRVQRNLRNETRSTIAGDAQRTNWHTAWLHANFGQCKCNLWACLAATTFGNRLTQDQHGVQVLRCINT